MELEGTILAGPTFDAVSGRVVVEDGEIAAVEETNTDSDDIVLPAFVNAHTHIGDSIAKEAGRGLTLDELVAPPDGLKHRLLRRASRTDLVSAMRRSMRFMERTGTSDFIEFREGGRNGVEMLHEAADGRALRPFVMGRGDAEDVLEVADGYGATGANDDEFGPERETAREFDKPFAIHAGEGDDSDIHPAIDLHPDLLVHMVHATPDHLNRVADEGIPIAVCPRSNLTTGVGQPDLELLSEFTTVALGTDNVFLNSPSMFREMEFAEKLSDLNSVEVLRMATLNGAEILDRHAGVVEEGAQARLLVLDGDTDNLSGYQDAVRAVVRRAGADDVKRVVLKS